MFLSSTTFTDFLAVVKFMYKEGVMGETFVRRKGLDPLKFGSSFPLHEVTAHLIKSQKTEQWQTELTEMATEDPNALFYLCDIYMDKGKLKEALTMLAKTLIKYPMMVQLLFK